jgi:hypothetical protein
MEETIDDWVRVMMFRWYPWRFCFWVEGCNLDLVVWVAKDDEVE